MARWIPLFLLGCTHDITDDHAGAGADDGGDAEVDPDVDTDTEPSGKVDTVQTGCRAGDTELVSGSTGATGDTGAAAFVWPDGLDRKVCADGTVEYTVIQDAIDDAGPGEVIGVCAGTYDRIELSYGDELTIIGVEGSAVTTIDGGPESAVYVRDAVLDISGFRVTGEGHRVAATDEAGGFTIIESEVVIRDCVVADTTGTFAMIFDEDFLVMEDVTWENNQTEFLWYLWQGTDATFTRQTVTGGVHQSLMGSVKLEWFTLTDSSFSGVAIDGGYSAIDLPAYGLGEIELANNVFYDIDDSMPWGGRLISRDSAIRFRNNVVMGCNSEDLADFEASYSIFWDNGGDYAAHVIGTDNQFVDPMFTDPANGDFTLLPGSPAIDAGDPDQALNDPDGTRSDIGLHGGQ